MSTGGYGNDPRYRLASLGAQAVYRAVRSLRDEHDTVTAVPGHTLAVSVAAAMGARADEVVGHLRDLARLGLLAAAGPEAVRLVPRPGNRARAADGTPRVARTRAEIQKAYRDRKAGRVTSGNGVTGNGSGNAGGNAGNEPAHDRENAGVPADGDGNAVGNGLGNGGNGEEREGGEVPLPPSALPSSSPTPPEREHPTPRARAVPAAGAQPALFGGEHSAAAKRARKRPAPRADVVPAEGTAAWRVWDAITRDAGLAEIVANPGDYAARVTDPRIYPGVDVLAVVLDAAEFLARGTHAYADGRAFLNNQLRKAAERAAARAKPDTARARATVPRPSVPTRGRLPAAAHADFADCPDDIEMTPTRKVSA